MEDKNAGSLFVFETKLNGFEGRHYGKWLVYYRPIFLLTKLAFLRARAITRENTFQRLLKFTSKFTYCKWLIIDYNYKY